MWTVEVTARSQGLTAAKWHEFISIAGEQPRVGDVNGTFFFGLNGETTL